MDIKSSARSCLEKSMAARPGECVLIVTDDEKLPIGTALYEAAKELGCRPTLLRMPVGTVSGEEPPPAVAKAMAAADVVLCPTVCSLTHTDAKIRAAKAGARIATMPGITEEMFCAGAITADYARVEELTLRVARLLTEAQTARLEKDGRVLTMDLRGRSGVPSTGVYRERGQAGNLPSGEAYIAPLEDGSQGEMVIDGSMVGVGLLRAPLRVRVEGGKLREITGPGSEKLGVLLENDRNATLGELGIGTNEKAILCGVILEDEKVYGTVHIAFGTNTSFGGVNKAGCHLDGVIRAPSLFLDGRPVLRDGEFVLENVI